MAHDPELERAIRESLKESQVPKVCSEDVPFGFQRVQIKPDGNCLFHAIGKAVGKDHQTVRQEICEWLSTNIYKNEYPSKKILQVLLADMNIIVDYNKTPHDLVIEDPFVKEKVDIYIFTIKTCGGKPEGYGGQIEIMVATILYKRSIVYFFSNGEGFNYKFSLFQNIDNNAIVLFNCKLEKFSEYRNHWELLKLEPGENLENLLLNLFTLSSAFRKNARKSPTRKRTSRKRTSRKRTSHKSPTRKRTSHKSPTRKRTSHKSPTRKRTSRK